MLQAGIFTNFKGADTLLVWGEADDINHLHTSLRALRDDPERVIIVPGCTADSHLSIIAVNDRHRISELTRTNEGLFWTCSRPVIDEAEALVGALRDATAGHQFVDVSGPLATTAMVAKGEYPQTLRP
jgi:hypothetical protein